jgi:hypothetical protein
MAVTKERLQLMLQNDVVSASMFRVGRDSILDRPYLCLITLNPASVVTSDFEATQYMLDLPEEVIARVHPARYLDHIDHLQFAIDHEAFHCLDSYYHGGVPRTDREFGGEYHLFRRESAADAYAMALHIKERGEITPYARNLVLVRALWLFSDTPNRCTFETVRELLKFDPKSLAMRSTEELIELAVHIRDRTVGTYESYVAQRAAALRAAQGLGLAPESYGEPWGEVAGETSIQALVDFLTNRYEFYYGRLFNDSPIPLDAPPGAGGADAGK